MAFFFLVQKTHLVRFGVGLTLSRLYAQYFGGDLKILSLDGFGTDACAQLVGRVLYKLNFYESLVLVVFFVVDDS